MRGASGGRSQCRRLILHCIDKEKSQPDINDAGQRQQHAEERTENVCGFVAAQISAAQSKAGASQNQQHHSKPKRHIVHPPLHAAECVDHIRKPLQLSGEARPQPRGIFAPLAAIKKAMPAVNGKIELPVRVEIYGEFSKGGVRQRQDAFDPFGGQNTKGSRFIAACQVEALVKVVISCFDGFDAKQLAQCIPCLLYTSPSPRD